MLWVVAFDLKHLLVASLARKHWLVHVAVVIATPALYELVIGELAFDRVLLEQALQQVFELYKVLFFVFFVVILIWEDLSWRFFLIISLHVDFN